MGRISSRLIVNKQENITVVKFRPRLFNLWPFLFFGLTFYSLLSHQEHGVIMLFFLLFVGQILVNILRFVFYRELHLNNNNHEASLYQRMAFYKSKIASKSMDELYIKKVHQNGYKRSRLFVGEESVYAGSRSDVEKLIGLCDRIQVEEEQPRKGLFS